jgi:glycosyltransferase involved in cell wall biosynthesis
MTCFIVSERNKGWILDRIAHEVGERLVDSIYHYDLDTIPKADRYVVMHYSLVPMVFEKVNPLEVPVTVFFTHESADISLFTEALNLCHSIIAENQVSVDLLEAKGVRADILHFVPEAGDPKRFVPHERTGNGAVLLAGAYYDRKNPNLILDVVRNSKRKFHLIGRDWERWQHFGELFNLPNFKYIKADYSEYPRLYAECDVFLSCSTLEGGGPNSLIESMHANLMPVASDTGNAREYITHGYNGFIFPTNSSHEHVCDLIERAYNLNTRMMPPYNDVSTSVESFNYDNYASQWKQIMTGVYLDSGI